MKRIFSLAFVLLPALFTLSCTKGGGNEPGGDTSKAQLSVVVKDAQAIYEVNQNESINLELYVAANPTSADALTVTVAAKSALVSTYNTQKGTSYQMLPSDAFTLGSEQLILPKYSAKSSNLQLRLKGASSCDPEVTYVLPIGINSVQGGTNFDAPDDKAAYIVFKMIPTESEGDGSQANPFVIKEVEDLLAMDAKLQDDATTYFKLGADLDLKDVTFTEEKPWKPINNYSDEDSQSAARKRMVSFDGDNHSISNLKADGPLFGILCGSVQNLTLSGFEIKKEGDDAAVLVGIAGAADNPDSFIAKNITITGSKVDNRTDIVQVKRAGGLVAYMRNGLVENCSADCSVKTPQQGGALIGRLNAGTVKNCSASGDVLAESYHGGGLIGFVSEGTVTGCHASGNVTQTNGGNSRVGGLIGSICGSATVEKSYATGNVEGNGHWGGGLIACIYDTVTSTTVNVSECYATGTVTMPHGETGNQGHVGALIGTVTPKSEATEFTVVNISNCYATGAVLTRRYSSGFLGSIYAAKAEVHILNSYTTSNISGIRVQERCGLVFGHGGSNLEEGKSKITCKGFVGWNTGDPAWRFSWGWEKEGAFFDAFPEDGNYNGHEGTVSQQAQALGGWSTDIWDFSGSEPKLKNVK